MQKKYLTFQHGKKTSLSHCNSKKQIRNDMKVKSFFQPKRAKVNPSKAVETDTV